MITRLQVKGFKNLVDVDLYFGPFTCIAGPNGVGKSNLFDVITFLSHLADKPVLEAAQAIRDSGSRSGSFAQIFHRVGDLRERRIWFAAEMLIPRKGIDDLGQSVEATTTFVRYELELELQEAGANGGRSPLRIVHESLEPIGKTKAKVRLPFNHAKVWREQVAWSKTPGRGRSAKFISTGQSLVRLHQDGGSRGRMINYLADSMPRTMLSTLTGEAPTAALVRNEMRSWRLLQLEPSALRRPDPYRAPAHLGADGSYLAATLFALANAPKREGSDPDAVYASVANRLSMLLEDVREVRIDDDSKRELLTVIVKQADGSEFPGSALSDGTLRFLALSVLEADRDHGGVICMEEPENGIHPKRVPAMLELLMDISSDPTSEATTTEPLRQVIVNTHSPTVVSDIQQEDIVFVHPMEAVDPQTGRRYNRIAFAALPGTWRTDRCGVSPVARSHALSYLNPPLLSKYFDSTRQLPRNAVAESSYLLPYMSPPEG